jgi:hypothetical protein
MARNPKAEIILSASDKTRGAFTSLNNRLSRLSSRLTTAGAIAGGAVVAGFAALTASQYKAIDSLAKTSDKLGVTTEKLSGLRLAAELTGVSSRNLDLGLQRLTRRIAEVATLGTGAAKPALEALNLSAQDLIRLSPDEQFREISKALEGVTNQSEKVALAFKLFDTEGVDLIRTLDLGVDGLDEIQQKALDFGIALNRVDAAKIEIANDRITEAKEVAKGAANVFAVAFAPAVTAIATAFIDSADASKGFKDEAGSAVETVVRLFGLLADVTQQVYRGLLVVKGATARVTEATADGVIALLDFLGRDVPQGLLDVSRAATDSLNESVNSLRASLEAGDISERIDRIYAETEANVKARADRIAEANERAAGSAPTVDAGAEERRAAAEKEAEEEQDRQQKALAKLEESLRSELEAEQASYQERLALVRNNLSAEGEEATRRAELLEKIEAEHQARLKEIRAGTPEAERKAKTQEALARLEESLLTEYEAEKLAYERKRALVEENIEAEGEQAERRARLLERIEAEHQENLAEIARRGAEDLASADQDKERTRLSIALSYSNRQLSVGRQQGKKMFDLQKKVALAEGLVDFHKSVMSAYRHGSDIGGPYVGAAFAAVAAAAQLANLNQIRSASFGGGATAGGGGSGGAATTVSNATTNLGFQEEPQQRRDEGRVLQITINGNLYGGQEGLVRLVDEIADRINNADQVVIEPRSANGQLLTAAVR